MKNVPQRLTPDRDLKECVICGRRLTSGRINVHEAICKKSSSITRERFTVSHQRVMGTEMERFNNMINKNCPNTPQKSLSCNLITNWRRKHEELIQRINKSKRGIFEEPKSNDLPFPPPTDCDNDYMQCPHCRRPINKEYASQHIEACANAMCKPNLEAKVDDLKVKPSQTAVEETS